MTTNLPPDSDSRFPKDIEGTCYCVTNDPPGAAHVGSIVDEPAENVAVVRKSAREKRIPTALTDFFVY
ncbi:hypothetical protein V6N11_030543 [Hibiscus sabdariffa]|uniref:Uncharacterized protein n=1 Tax=Hibiscus sabdariffa TaxID=183260 RepID=A0ABR2N7K1_9ROSI